MKNRAITLTNVKMVLCVVKKHNLYNLLAISYLNKSGQKMQNAYKGRFNLYDSKVNNAMNHIVLLWPFRMMPDCKMDIIHIIRALLCY